MELRVTDWRRIWSQYIFDGFSKSFPDTRANDWKLLCFSAFGRHGKGGRRGLVICARANAFQRDNPDAEVHLLDAGHFALESKGEETAGIIREFFGRAVRRSSLSAAH
jgi:hypothetical protein